MVVHVDKAIALGEVTMKCIDMIGQKFGKLTVVSRACNDKKGQAQWYCECECGGSTITTRYNLISGQTKSCGCILRSHKLSESDIQLQAVFTNMKSRCYNKNNTHYKYYGAKGITICEEWNNINAFREWAYANGYQPGLTIDRIDVNGNYEPSNCRWVSMAVQNKNKNNNRSITYKGETHLISEWATIVGIERRTIQYRLDKAGWTVEQALTIKPHPYNRINN